MILWAVFAVFILVASFAVSSALTFKRFIENAGDFDSEYFESSGNVAVLKISGVIEDSEETLEKIDELIETSKVKAVVLRISSPGGAVGPSQEIYDGVKRLREKKKVVCSFGDIAASGGYYIAAGCEKIVSNAGTLTGSIGVIMHFMNLQGLYAWAKVQPVTLKAGRYKDIGNEGRPMTDDERRLLQVMLDDTHAQFKKAVQEGRNLDARKVDEFADGRIFTGSQAKVLGFVDELGGEYEAIQLAAKLAGIEGEPDVVRERRSRKGFKAFFSESFEKGLTASIAQALSLEQFTSQFRLKPGVPYYLPSYMFESVPAK
jgi:protease IV